MPPASKHGGKRKGAGRPPASPSGAAVAVTVRLPPDLAAWLRAQDNQTQAVIRALEALRSSNERFEQAQEYESVVAQPEQEQ